MAEKKWLKKPAEFGQCRSFQHSWPKLNKRGAKHFIEVQGGAAVIRLECVHCATVRISRIHLHTGQMSSYYEYPVGYLLKRANKKEKLPSKGVLRKEFLNYLRR